MGGVCVVLTTYLESVSLDRANSWLKISAIKIRGGVLFPFFVIFTHVQIPRSATRQPYTTTLDRREQVEIRTFFTPGHVLQLPSRSGRRRHCDSQHKFIPSTQLQKTTRSCQIPMGGVCVVPTT